LRDKVRRIAAEPSIVWAEYQAQDDVINFYKFDPLRLRRADGIHQPGGPWIRRVRMHDMLGETTLRRLRLRFVRLHYQFVMANERRSLYDYS
jgi:hypothetical protein